MNLDYLSYKASKVFGATDSDGMFTREQLAEKRRLAERCSTCPYPDDCHVNACPYDILEKDKVLVEKLLKLHAEKNTDAQIAKKLQVKSTTVAALRVVLDLEENVVRKGSKITDDPCKSCSSRKVCLAWHGSCNERRQWEKSVGL